MKDEIYGCDFATNGDLGCEVYGHKEPDGSVTIDKVIYSLPLIPLGSICCYTDKCIQFIMTGCDGKDYPDCWYKKEMLHEEQDDTHNGKYGFTGKCFVSAAERKPTE